MATIKKTKKAQYGEYLEMTPEGKYKLTTKSNTPEGPRYYQTTSPSESLNRTRNNFLARANSADSVRAKNIDSNIIKKLSQQKNGGKMKKISKMEKGGALGMKSVKAGFDKNPGVTRADIIVAGKKEAKSGAKLKKQAATAIAMKKAGKSPKMKSGGTVSMQLGSYKNVIGKNTKGKATKAVGLTKAKYGKSMGKCKSGC